MRVEIQAIAASRVQEHPLDVRVVVLLPSADELTIHENERERSLFPPACRVTLTTSGRAYLRFLNGCLSCESS